MHLYQPDQRRVQSMLSSRAEDACAAQARLINGQNIEADAKDLESTWRLNTNTAAKSSFDHFLFLSKHFKNKKNCAFIFCSDQTF